MRVVLTVVMYLLHSDVFAEEAKRRVTIQEAVTLSGVGSVLVAPDGSFAYTTRTTDIAGNESETVWHGGACGGSPMVEKTPASVAVCSPDGRALAMVATVEGKTGICPCKPGAGCRCVPFPVSPCRS